MITKDEEKSKEQLVSELVELRNWAKKLQYLYDEYGGIFLFRDRDVLVAGPAVMDMQDSFELFWQDKDSVFVTQLTDVAPAAL